MIIYYDILIQGKEYYYLGANNKELLLVATSEHMFDKMLEDYSYINLEKNELILKKYKDSLSKYLLGEKTEFDFSYLQEGTTFRQKVWKEIAKIPYGKTRTYKDIAISINKPTAVRAVASAIAKNKLLIVIPCHRVIGSNGKLCGYRGGLALKNKLINLEKI